MMNEEQLKHCFCVAFDKDPFFEIETNAEKYDYQFSKGFDVFMASSMKASKHTYVSIGRHRVRIAVIAALIIVLLMATAISVSAIRRPIVSWFLKVSEKYGVVNLDFDVKDENELRSEFQYIKPTVPKDYDIVREDKLREYEQYEIEFENDEGKSILYIQYGKIENQTMSIDIEDNNLKKININGFKGYAASKYGTNSLYWSNDFYFFTLSGTCDMMLLEDIAKNI